MGLFEKNLHKIRLGITFRMMKLSAYLYYHWRLKIVGSMGRKFSSYLFAR